MYFLLPFGISVGEKWVPSWISSVTSPNSFTSHSFGINPRSESLYNLGATSGEGRRAPFSVTPRENKSSINPCFRFASFSSNCSVFSMVVSMVVRTSESFSCSEREGIHIWKVTISLWNKWGILLPEIFSEIRLLKLFPCK